MKTILITGASRGIGRSIAKTFAKQGYFVAINYNKSEDKAKSLFDEIVNDGGNAGLYNADVSSYEQLSLMFENVIKDVFKHGQKGTNVFISIEEENGYGIVSVRNEIKDELKIKVEDLKKQGINKFLAVIYIDI